MLRRIGTELPQCCYVAGFHGSEARRRLIFQQARQESNLQPPVLEPTPSNAGVAPFVDFQRLSFRPTTPALLDNAGVGTNPGTGEEQAAYPVSENCHPAFAQLGCPTEQFPECERASALGATVAADRILWETKEFR